MIIDMYVRESYVQSISNLIMLKAFHDAGVSIPDMNVKEFMVDVHYDVGTSFEILESGCSLLFEEADYLPYEEVEKIEEEYEQYGVFDSGVPETVLIIRDSAISRVLSSDKRNLFSELIDGGITSYYSEVEVTFCEETSELLVLIWIPGLFHELVLTLVEIHQRCKRLIEEENNAISDNDFRQTA